MCALGGATLFFGDLVRQLTVPAHHQFLGFSSYPGRSSASGEVRFTLDLSEPIEGRHVVLLEGTVVSGRTPAYIMDVLRRRGPASLRLCTLLLKRRNLRVPLEPDYVGFEIDADGMAVGYGMGHSPAERGLPYIATVPLQIAPTDEATAPILTNG